MEESHSKVRDAFISSCFSKANNAPSLANTHYLESAIGALLPTNPKALILEIGVGMGHFAYYATRVKNYSNYSGIDVSSECVQYVKQKITPNVALCTDVVAFLNTPAKYDAIILIDVIEHVQKAMQLPYLEAMRKALSDNGILIVRTENMAILTGWYQHAMDYTHENNFTPLSLEQLLRCAGFTNLRLFGDPEPKIKGLKSLARRILTRAWRRTLKLIFEIERPGCIHPIILTKNIYAACRKQR